MPIFFGNNILKNTTDTGEKPVSLLDHKTITSQPQFIQEEYDTGEFDQAEYLRQNPDVAADSWYGSRPAAHWQYFGQNEGRAYPTIKKTRQVENPNYTAAPMPMYTSTATPQTTPAGETTMPTATTTATPTTTSSKPQIMDESTGVNVGLGKQIRDQQALGAGNILTRTDAKLNDDIYITGNIGDSFLGLKLIKNNIKINPKYKIILNIKVIILYGLLYYIWFNYSYYSYNWIPYKNILFISL